MCGGLRGEGGQEDVIFWDSVISHFFYFYFFGEFRLRMAEIPAVSFALATLLKHRSQTMQLVRECTV